MSKYDLSIVIPALREEFLKNTVENILKNRRGKTEVIVVLDGEWANPPIDDHPDVRIIHTPNRGQRGATNLGVKLSTAKWVAKCDAHCAFDEGFDVKLLEAVKGHDDWTIVPAMKNLHAFNWVCSNCGTEYYQGEKPDKCPDELCQFVETTFEKKIYFIPRDMSDFKNRRGPTSTAYRFTPDKLQFKYFGKLKGYQDKEGDVAETMSLQGSFFMLTREKYWELNICDESWGGWGQQGTEVALKTWLSGGKVVCHRGTWYAHMFRTNNQLAFPWNKNLKESQGHQQHRARQTSIDLFKNNAWDKQTRGLSWLIERFWEPLQLEEPTDGDDRKWTKEDIEELKKTESRFSEELPPMASESDASNTPSKPVLVSDGEQVPPLAVGLPRVVSPSPPEDILGLSNELEVVGVAASGSLADNVVDNSTVEKRLDEPSIDDTMNQQGGGGKVLNRDTPITFGVTASLPNPATVGADDNLTEQGGNGVGLKPNSKRFRFDGHNSIISYGALYFTDNRLDEKIATWCREKLKLAIGDMPLACVSLQPLDFGDIRIVLPLERGYLTMYQQILAGLEALDTDVVFFCEHDVGYPAEHFDFTPPDKRFWYDQNWWKVHSDGLAVHWDADQVSGMVADRQELIKYYKYRIESFDKENFDRKFEPFSGEGSASWKAPVPHIDIRHNRNLTYSKRELKHFRKKETAVNFEQTNIQNIPGWSAEEIKSVL